MTRFIIVTLLLAVIAVVLRLRSRGAGPGRLLKITARAAVGRGTSLVVVEIEGRRLLVGAAANQMNVLAELGDIEHDGREDEPKEREPREKYRDAGRPDAPIYRALPQATAEKGPTSLVERVRAMTVRTIDPERRRRR